MVSGENRSAALTRIRNGNEARRLGQASDRLPFNHRPDAPAPGGNAAFKRAEIGKLTAVQVDRQRKSNNSVAVREKGCLNSFVMGRIRFLKALSRASKRPCARRLFLPFTVQTRMAVS